LVKFLFDHNVIDLLLFVTLRHHKQAISDIKRGKIVVKTTTYDEYSKKWRETSHQELYSQDCFAPLLAFKEVMRNLIYPLKTYEGASSPYVGQILDTLVKFSYGEEFTLASDLIDFLDQHTAIQIKNNTMAEYEEISAKISETQKKKFFNSHSSTEDNADKAWFKSLSKKPYIFWSQNWSAYLDPISSTLYKEALGDAGYGNTDYPVIVDYIRHLSEKQKPPKYEIQKNINYLNDKIRSEVKNADYYSEVIVLAKNMVTLANPESGNSSLKVAISYIRTIIAAKNISKVRAMLDSRILIKCIPYMQTDDVH
jgi:hypothetical protein